MAFFQNIVEFFQSLFMSSSPEVKKRQALRKIENDLRASTPVIFRGDLVDANFGEAIRQLMLNTKTVREILGQTMCTNEMERNMRYNEQLLLTGFPSDMQDFLESLEYETRKENARKTDSYERFFESEHRQLEKVLKYTATQEFKRMDGVIDSLRHLYDICNFSYISALHIFDNSFSMAEDYTPHFKSVSPELLETILIDLYHVVTGMDITVSIKNAILALGSLLNKDKYGTPRAEETILANLKRVQGLLRQVFNEKNLQNLIRLAKKDPAFVPTRASYHENALKNYCTYLEDRFQVDSTRLKNDLKDENISHDLQQIFGDAKLVAVNGYNNDFNVQLKQSPVSFMYTLPMQILKNFLLKYYVEHTKPLLNDVVIEGYFNNSAYKSDFSSTVYTVNDSLDRIKKFEDKFQRNGDFDETTILNYLRDSHKDTVFQNRLREMVETINKIAKEIIQNEVNNLYRIYILIGELLLESKKANSDVISNLRVLTLSSRNRENAEVLEKQYGLWKLFLDIMKNYVIINTSEKK